MHVCAESFFVELLDEAGEPAPQGELGRVVLTSLHNFAMPLIRYDIGDLAAFGPACSCGRGLPALLRFCHTSGMRRRAVAPWVEIEKENAFVMFGKKTGEMDAKALIAEGLTVREAASRLKIGKTAPMTRSSQKPASPREPKPKFKVCPKQRTENNNPCADLSMGASAKRQRGRAGAGQAHDEDFAAGGGHRFSIALTRRSAHSGARKT
jgi:hypothetical protein